MFNVQKNRQEKKDNKGHVGRVRNMGNISRYGISPMEISCGIAVKYMCECGDKWALRLGVTIGLLFLGTSFWTWTTISRYVNNEII